jgi:YVTN family beta-propeller protein
MSIRSSLLLLVLTATSVVPAVSPAAPKPPLCTGGRFAVSGDPLLGAGGELIVLEGRTVTLGTLCAGRQAKLKRKTSGTSLAVTFPKSGCTGVDAKVRLKALITEECSVMSGALTVRGAEPVDFTAATSVCGDGVIDPELGETCDGSAVGCGPSAVCDDTCGCLQLRADKSSPIEITADGKTVVAANSDTGTATFFAVGDDGLLTKRQEVAVGEEPRSVATLVQKPWAYVANTVSGTVSVIDLTDYSTLATIDVGTEPWAVVASPNGRFVYVATANDDAVQVIDTESNEVVATVPVSRSPRALAITNDGDDDDLDELVYVPSYFARPRADFVPPSTDDLGGADGPGAAFPANANGQPVIGEGIFDDAREAVVDVIATADNTIVDQVVLAPMADTGFNFPRGAFVNTTPGDAPRTVFADGATDGSVAQPTGAFPNLLQSIALFDGRGFVPSRRCAST